MNLFNILVVIGILVVLFYFIGWYTINRFNETGSDNMERPKHIEDDMKRNDDQEER